MPKFYKIRCQGGFRDGNVLPDPVDPGTEMEVDEALYKRLKQSDPDAWEVLESYERIPKSTRAKQTEEKPAEPRATKSGKAK